MAADDEHDGDEEFGDEFGESASEMTATSIEVTGLSLYTHHGVSDAEQEIGQRLVFDLRFDVGACDATVTDRVEDTVDYGRVCEFVSLVAQRRSYRTLEALCTEVAGQLLDEFDTREVWVKATKPEPPIALAVESVSVEVWQSAAER
ncbi:MAG: dihydroneopterin aldolase [Actinobacteria bacterium]|uniref:dihydroneopterin aldolase n=1 Tax=freshwater metagenome TaxID=449393 RepID=A0A6J5ZFI0_9ZZZZ|nr:dihydroneopterin aldolase [Actinomycetota bacterium]